MLRDLRAASARSSAASRQQQLYRLAIPRAVMKWQPGAASELGDGGNEILIDESCDARSRVLDQLSFSHVTVHTKYPKNAQHPDYTKDKKVMSVRKPDAQICGQGT